MATIPPIAPKRRELTPGLIDGIGAEASSFDSPLYYDVEASTLADIAGVMTKIDHVVTSIDMAFHIMALEATRPQPTDSV